jgi:diguanylate cyclase (GGDEF)-like protein
MDSQIGLIIQLNGVIIIAALCLLLGRSLKITPLKYWTIAWLSLSFALICVRLAFLYEFISPLLFTYYYFGEYLFGMLLAAGCRSLDGRWVLKPRSEFIAAPLILLAIGLPLLPFEYQQIQLFHNFVMCVLFALAFIMLRRNEGRSFGWKIMHVCLGGLVVNFIGYAALSLSEISEIRSLGSVSAYNAVIDVILRTLLGIGMVVELLERVLTDAKSAHERLESSNKRLSELVHTDPLTAAFSRHAFYGFVRKHDDGATETSGCVGFFDIDDLKMINDRYGHTAGDIAIRSVVKAVREVIRAEDLIFRWGGDEFFVIMISMDTKMAESRMPFLEDHLKNIVLNPGDEPVDINVSWGFKNFTDISHLEDAINRADAQMYTQKIEKKRYKEMAAIFPPFTDVSGSQHLPA